jgi:hypothetical protein
MMHIALSPSHGPVRTGRVSPHSYLTIEFVTLMTAALGVD